MSLFKTELPMSVAADKMIFFLEQQCANKQTKHAFGQFVLRAMYTDKEIADKVIPIRSCFVTLREQEPINTETNKMSQGYVFTVSPEDNRLFPLRDLNLERNTCFLSVINKKIVDVGNVKMLDS